MPYPYAKVPIPYQVCYDPSQIQENHTYSRSVRITDADGNLLFINDTHIPIITRSNPTQNVEVPLSQWAARNVRIPEAAIVG